MAAKLKPGDFVHLHNHTQYSLLDGLTKVPALIEAVKAMGMQSVAITDHGTLSGVIEFYKAATVNGIKPLIGMETYVAPRQHTDRDPTKDKNPYHLILLAMDNTGYQNLMRLSTIANLEGFYYRPRIDHALLEKYNEGLIVLSGCIGGEVGDALRQGQYEQAEQTAKWYKAVFGDRYYLEVQDHGHAQHPSAWEEQVEVTDQTLKLAQKLDIPCVLTCDAHYLKHADQEAHEILLCVQTGSYLSDEKRMSLKEFELHVTDPQEIIKRWGDAHPELVRNTKQIADRCSVTIELDKILIPKFPVPKGKSEKSFLHELVWQGLSWRYGGIELLKRGELTVAEAKKTLDQTIIERAEYELGVMDQMGYNGYFLIVQDFINWGKDQGVIFGPGRGSAAGSIVSYALRITEIDPMKYNLMFERFLNPNRISMPDIDIDIQDTRRDEVIKYCVDKYGPDRVANIVTFGRMAARNAVRDVARVLQVPYAEADRLAKMIPPPVQGRHIPLATSLQQNLELKAEYDNSDTAKRVFDLAMQLEGTIRSHGVHAAGVVIAPEDIVCYTPLEMAQKGVVATQYSMGPIEELGLLKMDFLGLSNLTILKNALRIVKRVYGRDIELSDIPNDDAKTIGLFQTGDTTGVFQFESAGMKRYMKELKPTEFTDLVAMNALYRPGPMAEIPRFIEGKHNQSAVSYLHNSLEPILHDTYGVMVYQEQITQLLQLVAGYSAGEADLVRKAIGKKKRDIMHAEEPKFIAGCIKQGLTKTQAHQLWKQIQPFADYSFNKAHATCYAQIAYWTAYLKANYPAAFMAALMTSDYDNTDRLAIEIKECTNMGLEVLPPDVNESFQEFAVVPDTNQIRFGMTAIKNVGAGAVEEILRAREDGKFTSLEDFFKRVSVRIVNRKALESLIKAGAFDRFGERSHILFNLDTLLAFAARLQKQVASGQTDLFGDLVATDQHLQPKLKLDTTHESLPLNEQLQWERELLGLYLSHHPLEDYKIWLSEQAVPLQKITIEHDNRSVQIGGLVTELREIVTRNGQKMAFVKIADELGEIEVVVFPKVYSETAEVWQRDNVILGKGKVVARDKDGKATGEPKILINEARRVPMAEVKQYHPSGKKSRAPKTAPPAEQTVPLATIAAVTPRRVYIRLENSDNQQTLVSLKQALDEHKGQTEVVLVLGPEANRQVIKLPMRIHDHEDVLLKIQTLVGASNVKVR